MIRYEYIWDIGCRRPVNQDSLLLLPDHGVFAVADGLGGQKGGEIASAMALSEIVAYWASINTSFADPVLSIKVAGERILQESRRNSERSGMCTTVTLLKVDSDEIKIAHIGDSRAYLISEGGCWPLTKDHSWIASQVEKGELSRQAAATAPHRNVLLRSVGIEPEFLADSYTLTIKQPMAILLCTDGLHNKVTPQELQSHLHLQTPTQPSGLETLLHLAKDRGGEDNISAIVLWINP